MFFLIILYFITCMTDCLCCLPLWNKEVYYDWSAIDYTTPCLFKLSSKQSNDALGVCLNNTFIFGTADSSMQVEGYQKANGGMASNNWSKVEHSNKIRSDQGFYKGVEFKTRFKEDIDYFAQLKLTTYRFSIAWEKVEPLRNVFDRQELDWYVELIDYCTERNIQPMINFFHHYWPVWFDVNGGWLNHDNIEAFVNYVGITYQYLYERVKDKKALSLIMTLNEPVGYACGAYIAKKLPPYKSMQIYNAGLMVKNLLDAHIGCYEVLKSINPLSQIGIAFVFIPMDPYNTKNPLAKKLCDAVNYMMHDVRYNYLTQGHFAWYGIENIVKSKPLIEVLNPHAVGKIDWIGLNYYTHKLLKMIPFNTDAQRDGTQRADNHGNIIYPEGLMRAIQKAAEFKLPIIITENGIQTTNDALKNKFVQQHLWVVHMARQLGYDIRGYMWWAARDTLGWNIGKPIKHYGFVHVDPITKQRTFLHDAADHLMKTISISVD